MGKPSKRKRRAAVASSYKSKPKNRKDDALRAEDSEDEIDAFHKQRDVIPLDINKGGELEDEDLEQSVFDFEDAGEDDSDDMRSKDGADSNEDDDGDDDEIQPKGFAAKIARQAKYLKQKFGGGGDDMEDDDEEEDDEEGKGKTLWGRSKNSYYNADNIDYEIQSSDEDLLKEEEAEVLRIQRERAGSFAVEDFGLEDSEEDGSDTERRDKTSEDGLLAKKSRTKHEAEGAFEASPLENYEEIKKDIRALSKEEQMDVVLSSAPELVGLLSELNDALKQIEKIKPNLSKAKGINNLGKDGMHNLEAKWVLLSTYCQAISFYLLLKTEGLSVRDHPVIARLVEIKDMLEKMKEIDVNIPSLMEDTFNHASLSGFSNTGVGEKIPSATNPEKSGRIVAQDEVHASTVFEMDGSLKDGRPENTNKIKQESKDAQMGLQSLEMLKVRATLEAKLKEKGLYDISKSKPEKLPKPKPSTRYLETLDDFDDEVKQNTVGGIMNNGRAIQQSKLIATRAGKPTPVSGDDDLPQRDDIGDRRRKHELRVLARVGTGSADDDDDGEENTAKEDRHSKDKSMDITAHEECEIGSEDEFYEVKRQRLEKLATKEQIPSKTPVVLPLMEDEAGGKRQITYQMEKNRGLTRPRKKLAKIPRKKYKQKHQKAVKRRKGQVRDIRKPSGPYGGESSGINPGVSRSVRFKT